MMIILTQNDIPKQQEEQQKCAVARFCKKVATHFPWSRAGLPVTRRFCLYATDWDTHSMG
jgi:hypothetical protein